MSDYHSVRRVQDTRTYAIVHHDLVEALGLVDAYVFSHFLHKQKRLVSTNKIKPNGLFYFTRTELAEVCRIPEKTARNAITRLKEIGLLRAERIGFPPKSYYWINYKVLDGIIAEREQERIARQRVSDFSDLTGDEPPAQIYPTIEDIESPSTAPERDRHGPGEGPPFKSSNLGVCKSIPSECSSSLLAEREGAVEISPKELYNALVEIAKERFEDSTRQTIKLGYWLCGNTELPREVEQVLGIKRVSITELFPLEQYNDDLPDHAPDELLDPETWEIDWTKVPGYIYKKFMRMEPVKAQPSATPRKAPKVESAAPAREAAPIGEKGIEVVYKRGNAAKVSEGISKRKEPGFATDQIKQDYDPLMIHWRKLKEKHPNLPQPRIGSGEYKMCLELFDALRQGRIGMDAEFPIDKDYATKYGIALKAKRYTDQQIKEGLTNVALTFDRGYLPRDKSTLIKQLSQMMYRDNGHARFSLVLSYMQGPPDTVDEANAQQVVKHNPLTKQTIEQIVKLIQTVRPTWEPAAGEIAFLSKEIERMHKFFTGLPEQSYDNRIEECFPSFEDLLAKFLIYVKRRADQLLWPEMTVRAFNRDGRAFSSFLEYMSKDYGVSFKTGDSL